MKKYSQIVEQLAHNATKATNPLGYDREAYIGGKMFNVGDLVECNGKTAEIISLGTNYVNLIREGKTFKAWVSDIKPSDKKIDSAPIAESFEFKGYKTKNLSEDITSHFKNKTVTYSDSFAMFNCIVSCDKLMGIGSADLRENFDKFKTEFDKSTRYLKKFDLHIAEMSGVEDKLLEHAIINDLCFVASDRMKVARVIAGAMGVPVLKESPSELINKSILEFKSGRHSQDAWQLAGSMLNRATDAGIEWDKTILKTSTKRIMGIR